MFSFQRRVAPTTIASTSSTAPSMPPPAPSGSPRYPKRNRAEVKYYDQDESDASTDFELDCIPTKRPRTQVARNTKPLPRRKIFPFLSLPAELRNRIYEECAPPPTQVPEDYEEGKSAIWFRYKQRFYRKTIEYIPSVVDDLEGYGSSYQYGNGRYAPTGHTRRGKGRARTFRERLVADADSDSDAEEPEKGPKSLGFNILAVCKQIYDEAAPMMYAQNFVFTDVDALFSFASQLTLRTAKLLRHIEIRTWGLTRSRKTRGYAAMAMLAAKGVTELETLYINCGMAYFHSWSWRNGDRSIPIPKRVAKKVYRDCHLWLEAVGTASGDPFKGIEVLKVSDEMFENGRAEGIEEEEMKMYKKELRRLLETRAW